MKRTRLASLAAVVTAVALAGACVVAVHQRTDFIDAAQHSYDAAVHLYHAAHRDASASLASSTNAVASARETLKASDGRVLSEVPRQALAAALTAAQNRLDAENREFTLAGTAAGSAPEDDASYFEPGSGLAKSTATVQNATARINVAAPSISESLIAPERQVRDAMTAWQNTLYTNRVQAVGWIPELDQCLGSVDITAHYDGVAAIAEHWSCGGKNFPDDAGTVIQLTGLHSGLYRVDGIVAMLNSSRNSVADLPRGYDLLYQTCQNGQGATMSFTALTKLD